MVHCNQPEIAHMTVKGEAGGRVRSLAAMDTLPRPHNIRTPRIALRGQFPSLAQRLSLEPGYELV